MQEKILCASLGNIGRLFCFEVLTERNIKRYNRNVVYAIIMSNKIYLKIMVISVKLKKCFVHIYRMRFYVIQKLKYLKSESGIL